MSIKWNEMSIDELVSRLYQEYMNGHTFTIDELNEIVDCCSVKDNEASPNALTLLYSGGEDYIVNKISETNNSDIRILRRTDLYKLLTSRSPDNFVSFSDGTNF